MRSPAEPASSLALSAALYSVGADRREVDLDAGVRRLEGRDDLLLPDGEVVVAPAFDRERLVLGRGIARPMPRMLDAISSAVRVSVLSFFSSPCWIVDCFRFPLTAGACALPSSFDSAVRRFWPAPSSSSSAAVKVGRAGGQQHRRLDRAAASSRDSAAASSSQPRDRRDDARGARPAASCCRHGD